MNWRGEQHTTPQKIKTSEQHDDACLFYSFITLLLCFSKRCMHSAYSLGIISSLA